MRKSLKHTIMERDGIDEDEADDRIEKAISELDEVLEEGGDSFEAERVIEDHFGLEPDYLDDLLPPTY